MEAMMEPLTAIKPVEIKVSYQRAWLGERPKVKTTEEAASLLRATFDADEMDFRESMHVLFLNKFNMVLGYYPFTGTMDSVTADPSIIFGIALKTAARCIIFAHNHPSGNPVASHSDIEFTTRMQQAAKLLNIQVLDHLIFTSEGVISLCEQGLL